MQLKFFIVYHLAQADRERAVATLTHLLQRGALTHLLQRGALTHRIGHCLPLDEIALAHERVEQGSTQGKVLLEL